MSENTISETIETTVVPDENDVERTYGRLDVINDEMVVVPAGTYVIGDPCYTVPDECWGDWLEAADYQNMHVLAATIDGHHVIGIGTAYGDGSYEDAQGNDYPVDAGLIGLVPLALVDTETRREDLGRIVEFTEPVVCHWTTDEGTITLGHIKIKTDPEPEPITCFACGRPSDCEDYCTWGCGYGEEEPDDDEDDDDIDDEDEE